MPYLVTTAMATLSPEDVIDELTLTPPPGDWTDFGNYCEHIKIWLPQPVADAAAKLAEQFNQSTTITIRHALVIHVYGRLAFDQLVMNGALRPPRGYVNDVVNSKQLLVDELKAHRAGQTTDLAKEDRAAHVHLVAQEGRYAELRPIVGLRVSVPKRLKDDLLELAAGAGDPLSEYCRAVLSNYYLGAQWV